MRPFIPKQDDRLPDFFTITLRYLTGRKESIEVVSIRYIESMKLYEIWTTDDLMKVVPLSSIECIDYDKQWSKVVAIREEMNKEKEKVE